MGILANSIEGVSGLAGVIVHGEKGEPMEWIVEAETLSDFIDHGRYTLSTKPLIRCKDCKYCDRGIDEDGNPFLKCLGWAYGGTQEEDFCSHAERRTDEQT